MPGFCQFTSTAKLASDANDLLRCKMHDRVREWESAPLATCRWLDHNPLGALRQVLGLVLRLDVPQDTHSCQATMFLANAVPQVEQPIKNSH